MPGIVVDGRSRSGVTSTLVNPSPVPSLALCRGKYGFGDWGAGLQIAEVESACSSTVETHVPLGPKFGEIVRSRGGDLPSHPPFDLQPRSDPSTDGQLCPRPGHHGVPSGGGRLLWRLVPVERSSDESDGSDIENSDNNVFDPCLDRRTLELGGETCPMPSTSSRCTIWLSVAVDLSKSPSSIPER